MLNLILGTEWENFLTVIQRPPGSTIFVIFLSIGIGMFTVGLQKLLSNPKRLLEKQKQIKDHQAKRKEIEELQEKNPKRYQKELSKWERRDPFIQKMQQKMSLSRLKPTCITFLPMIIFFTALRGFYTYNGVPLPVAIPPMNANDVFYIGNMMAGYIDGVFGPAKGMINFTAWYFLNSFTFSTTMQKLFGLQTVSGGGLGDMFDQSKYDTYKTK
ncbi:MAG: DUF106 domain-containing protein [Candidatus Lokiarchaeota archaeon]|nr:DUF106 domain-containing protein [Candidatus Lokiarchaeota archaeon]